MPGREGGIGKRERPHHLRSRAGCVYASRDVKGIRFTGWQKADTSFDSVSGTRTVDDGERAYKGETPDDSGRNQNKVFHISSFQDHPISAVAQPNPTM